MDQVVHNIFPTAVMEFKLPFDTATIKTQLETYNSQLKPHAVFDGNATTTTDEAFHLLADPQFDGLRIEFDKCIKEYSKVMGFKPQTIQNSWFNVMNKGATLGPHVHRASIISGGYYPKCPEGSVGLTFRSPLEPYNKINLTRLAKDLVSDIYEDFKSFELYDKDTEYNAKECTFPVREGHLLLWPSWFQHETKVNTTNERYVISFNTIIKGNYAQHE